MRQGLKLLWGSVGAAVGAMIFVALAYLVTHNLQKDQQEFLVKQTLKSISTQAHNVVREAQHAISAFEPPDLGPCNRLGIEAMQAIMIQHVHVKDMAVVGSRDRRTHCNSSGNRIPIASQTNPVNFNGEWSMQAVQVHAAHFEGLLISRQLSAERRIETLILSNALLSAQSGNELLYDGYAILKLSNGVVAARYPEAMSSDSFPDLSESHFTESQKIQSLPITVEIGISREVASELSDVVEFFWFFPAFAIGGVIGGLIGGFFTGAKAEIGVMEAAIRNGEIVAHYQPVVNLKTGDIMGCEALMRWQKPDGTIVPPNSFLPQVEVSDLGIRITKHLMEIIVRDLGDFYAINPTLKIGINLFRRHLERIETVSDIEECFGGSIINYQQLMFEVTERLPIEDQKTAQKIITHIQELGAGIALDDVGTGHNGLQYIMEFGANAIKIDKIFVDGLDNSGFALPVIQALVSLAQDLNMNIVAEGIETTAQMRKLRDLGVTIAQGFLFSKPLPPEQFIKLVQESQKFSKQDHAEAHLRLVSNG